VVGRHEQQRLQPGVPQRRVGVLVVLEEAVVEGEQDRPVGRRCSIDRSRVAGVIGR
jgi:hypothetical protein